MESVTSAFYSLGQTLGLASATSEPTSSSSDPHSTTDATTTATCDPSASQPSSSDTNNDGGGGDDKSVVSAATKAVLNECSLNFDPKALAALTLEQRTEIANLYAYLALSWWKADHGALLHCLLQLLEIPPELSSQLHSSVQHAFELQTAAATTEPQPELSPSPSTSPSSTPSTSAPHVSESPAEPSEPESQPHDETGTETDLPPPSPSPLPASSAPIAVPEPQPSSSSSLEAGASVSTTAEPGAESPAGGGVPLATSPSLRDWEEIPRPLADIHQSLLQRQYILAMDVEARLAIVSSVLVNSIALVRPSLNDHHQYRSLGCSLALALAQGGGLDARVHVAIQRIARLSNVSLSVRAPRLQRCSGRAR